MLYRSVLDYLENPGLFSVITHAHNDSTKILKILLSNESYENESDMWINLLWFLEMKHLSIGKHLEEVLFT